MTDDAAASDGVTVFEYVTWPGLREIRWIR